MNMCVGFLPPGDTDTKEQYLTENRNFRFPNFLHHGPGITHSVRYSVPGDQYLGFEIEHYTLKLNYDSEDNSLSNLHLDKHFRDSSLK